MDYVQTIFYLALPATSKLRVLCFGFRALNREAEERRTTLNLHPETLQL